MNGMTGQPSDDDDIWMQTEPISQATTVQKVLLGTFAVLFLTMLVLAVWVSVDIT